MQNTSTTSMLRDHGSTMAKSVLCKQRKVPPAKDHSVISPTSLIIEFDSVSQGELPNWLRPAYITFAAAFAVQEKLQRRRPFSIVRPAECNGRRKHRRRQTTIMQQVLRPFASTRAITFKA